MAASTKPDSTFLQLLEEKYLECSLCFEEYKQPKSLCCLHSFCENCLLEYVEHNSGKDIVCPTCREVTPIPQGGVTKLKNNFLIKSLTDDASLFKNQKVKCDACDAGNVATIACVECSHYLCADCFKGHQRIKSIRESHTTFEIQKLSNVVNLQQFQRNRFAVCEIHNEPKKLFCKTDNIQLCHTCAFTASHKSHEVFSLQEQVDLLLSEINTELVQKAPTESTIEAENQKFESVITDANEIKDNSLQDLRKEKALLIQKIKERYDSLESEIETSVQETIKMCKEKIKRNNVTKELVKSKMTEKEALRMIPISSCQQAAEVMLGEVRKKIIQVNKVSDDEGKWKYFVPNGDSADNFTTGTVAVSKSKHVVVTVDKTKSHYKGGRNVRVGDHVTRSPNWQFGNQVITPCKAGTITVVTSQSSHYQNLGVCVKWDHSDTSMYFKMGYEGKYELKLK